MVVIDDYRKLLLCQRLNLGYECIACKKKFYNKREQVLHLQEVHLNPPKKDNYVCTRCGKTFANLQVYRLHAQIHNLSEVSAIQEKIKVQNDRLATIEEKITKTVNKSAKAKEKQSDFAGKKPVGLTKVKMEDCLRCDACSCIYLDKNDYFKHMRNFHKVTELETIVPSEDKPAKFMLIDRPNNSPNKKKCRACCKQCRGNHSPEEEHQNPPKPIKRKSNVLFQFTMQDNIKDRWSKMVSQRLLETEEEEEMRIKPDPDEEPKQDAIKSDIYDQYDISHLLSQVEVKIKTEPMEDE